MSSSWRLFSYVMGGNFQVLLLFLGAHELSAFCSDKTSALCSCEPYFILVALCASVLVYYKVFHLLLKVEKQQKKEE